MKKSLKVIASAASAFLMFASAAMADTAATTGTSATATAAAKTSADFKDLANVDASLKAKIDALLKAGVIEGVSADSFGIDQNMTRAQAAKVLTLIYNVKVDDSVKTSGFSDVNADDKANGWAIPYIEAAKKAGLIDGVTDTAFAPGDKVTLGQLAAMLIKGLGKKVDVSGTPWYKDAVAQAAADKLLPEGVDGAQAATRADLVTGAFGGQEAYAAQNKPAAVSVKEVKITGVKTVQVIFDRDVDTAKAVLSLKNGSSAVTTTTKWSDDKKSAALTLTDTKLMAGEYTVTLAGLDAADIKTATGTFTAQDETVQKLEFVTTSDSIAYTSHAAVTLKATNQYGENASFTSGAYSVIAGNNNDVQPVISKNDDGTLKIKMNTKSLTNAQQNVSVIPVNVWFNDTHLSVSKNFTLGVAPFVTKLELGDVKYTTGTAINKLGEVATIALKLYDQYGGLIGTDSDAYSSANLNTLFTPYESNLQVDKTYVNTDHPNDPFVRVSLLNDLEKSGDYNLQVYYQGSSATTKISVKSAAVASKVAIGDLDGVIASGDSDVYIPILAYDEAGNQLSTDDLIADKNRDRIHLSVSGAGYEAKIMNTGDKKGTIHIPMVTAPAKSVISVTAYIATTGASSTSTKNYTIADVRTPDRLKIATEPAKKIVAGTNSYTPFVVQAIDQNGSSRDNFYILNNAGAMVTTATPITGVPASATDVLTAGVVGNVYYFARVTQSGTNSTNFMITPSADNKVNADPGVPTTPVTGSGAASTVSPANFGSLLNKRLAYFDLGNGTYAYRITDFDRLNDTYRIYAFPGANGTVTFKVELVKALITAVDASGNITATKETVIDTQTRSVDVVPSTADLTYSLNSIATLWNALDSGVIKDTSYVNSAGTTITVDDDAVQKAAPYSKFAREITISAKHASGDAVAIPKKITAVVTSNPSVAQAVYWTNPATNDQKAYVIGKKAGTAIVSVTFQANDGTQKQLSTTVTVKGDALTADYLKNGNTGVQAFTFSTAGVIANAWDAMNLSTFDNYNVEYNKQAALQYNYLLGVTFSFSNVKPINSALAQGSISIDQYGNISTTGGNVTFDVTATAPNGKSVTTPFKIN